MKVKAIHQRLAELWVIEQNRPLTAGEALERQHCLAANAAYVWKAASCANLSLLASMTNDTEWQHEICMEMERLELS
ncbi:DUF7667 family protein [Paenibacillus koleovorans]|uniref:DUF7667 family protein n=1 Tax=Paenibacillus koleovorans TaxID=121608 RepID=UPI000FD964AE|nr:hypothetical protein [Paenibacillus koleovorans]